MTGDVEPSECRSRLNTWNQRGHTLPMTGAADGSTRHSTKEKIMYSFLKNAALATVLLTSVGLVSDAPSAQAQGYLSTQSSGPSQAVCGKKRCFSISNGKWYIRKH